MICCYDNNDISKWSQIYIYSNPVNDRICVVCFLDNYDKVGCYRDGNNPRAITSLEGTDTTLDGHYKSRKNAIGKCVVAALQHIARSTDMEYLLHVRLMEKVDQGAIRSIRLKVDRISVV